jgi:hypothetical protein
VELVRIQQILMLAKLIRLARSRSFRPTEPRPGDGKASSFGSPRPESVSPQDNHQIAHALLAEAWALLDKLDAALDAWGQMWRVPLLHQIVRYEFCRRLRSSMARSHPASGQIRLNVHLLTPPNRELLVEIFCQEAALIAVWQLHGNQARPRGPEWEQLIAQARFPLRTTTSSGRVHTIHLDRTARLGPASPHPPVAESSAREGEPPACSRSADSARMPKQDQPPGLRLRKHPRHPGH